MSMDEIVKNLNKRILINFLHVDHFNNLLKRRDNGALFACDDSSMDYYFRTWPSTYDLVAVKKSYHSDLYGMDLIDIHYQNGTKRTYPKPKR